MVAARLHKLKKVRKGFSMKYKLIVLIAILPLIAAACNKSSNSATSNSGGTNQAVQSGTAEIDMTDSGFSPSNITVKSGTVVIFKNTSSKTYWPASNPHPTHTDLPGFDALRGLNNGETYSFTFTKLGVWGFHDHLNPTLDGRITVVQ
jgi:plastocyanin